jgi:hypothetical protein
LVPNDAPIDQLLSLISDSALCDSGRILLSVNLTPYKDISSLQSSLVSVEEFRIELYSAVGFGGMENNSILLGVYHALDSDYR